jgi:hypothetical protein
MSISVSAVRDQYFPVAIRCARELGRDDAPTISEFPSNNICTHRTCGRICGNSAKRQGIVEGEKVKVSNVGGVAIADTSLETSRMECRSGVPSHQQVRAISSIGSAVMDTAGDMVEGKEETKL